MIQKPESNNSGMNPYPSGHHPISKYKPLLEVLTREQTPDVIVPTHAETEDSTSPYAELRTPANTIDLLSQFPLTIDSSLTPDEQPSYDVPRLVAEFHSRRGADYGNATEVSGFTEYFQQLQTVVNDYFRDRLPTLPGRSAADTRINFLMSEKVQPRYHLDSNKAFALLSISNGDLNLIPSFNAKGCVQWLHLPQKKGAVLLELEFKMPMSDRRDGDVSAPILEVGMNHVTTPPNTQPMYSPSAFVEELRILQRPGELTTMLENSPRGSWLLNNAIVSALRVYYEKQKKENGDFSYVSLRDFLAQTAEEIKEITLECPSRLDELAQTSMLHIDFKQPSQHQSIMVLFKLQKDITPIKKKNSNDTPFSEQEMKHMLGKVLTDVKL